MAILSIIDVDGMEINFLDVHTRSWMDGWLLESECMVEIEA